MKIFTQILAILTICCLSLFSFSQTELPFRIDSSKLLSKERLSAKKEGWFLTGIPKLGFDPIQGFGIGADAELYFNSNKEDPFFAWTPYRLKTEFGILFTQNGKTGATVKFDAPYFLKHKMENSTTICFYRQPQ
jgi:hypothetical protein